MADPSSFEYATVCLNSDEDSGSDDDTNLPVHLKVRKYACSFHKQKAIDAYEEWFKTAPAESIENELPNLMTTIQVLCEVSRFEIKQEWLKQIPTIASQAVLYADKAPILNSVIVDYLLPIVVKNLGTSENIVNKTAQEALLELMRRKLIPLPHLEIRVCPSVLALSQDMENVACANPSIVT